MANKSSKIIFLLLSTILVALLIIYIQSVNELGWRDVNGFELNITGDVDQIEEFYSSLKQRLMGYPDWINIVLTGELSNFQKDYAPFRTSIDMFDSYNKIYTSTDMTRLISEYSSYLESVLLDTQGMNPDVVESELNRLFQFCSILYANFIDNENVFVGDIIDLMKFDINPYFKPINKTHTIYIFLQENNNINSQFEQIRNQIQVEINELTKLIDVDASITKRNLQIKTINNIDLLINHEKYNSPQYSHIYKYLPSINFTEFNSRMTLIKQSIHREKTTAASTAIEFRGALSKIEEQLIEFESRNFFPNIHILEFVNTLVGDKEAEFGILTGMINLLYDRRYTYKINDYLSKTNKYLKSETNKIPELTYPTIQTLPNRLSSKFIKRDRTLIFKIN